MHVNLASMQVFANDLFMIFFKLKFSVYVFASSDSVQLYIFFSLQHLFCFFE